jgi:hypothetical protein
MEPRHVDGNAIGGLLRDLFGMEMTAQVGCCDRCGAEAALGQIHVFVHAPGHVHRCPTCGTVLAVIVPQGAGYRINYETLRWTMVNHG